MGILNVGYNLAIGAANVSFEEAGATDPSVVESIHKVGNIPSSYDPKETLNSLTEGFVVDGPYIIKMKQQKDWPFLQNKAVNVTAAPTLGVVDDSANTFNWTNNPGYPSLASYEYTINGGTTFADVSAKPIDVGNEDRPIGQVGVRVKAATGRPVSSTLYNTAAFTSTGGGSYDSDAAAYFVRVAAAGATLTNTEKTAYNTFVIAAKTNGYYSKLKTLNIYWGNAAAAKLNAITNSFNQTWVGGMTYARFAAVSNGTTGYAKNGFIPANDFSLNNYAFGGWYNDNTDAAQIEVGAKSGSSVSTMYLLPRQGNVAYISAHSTAASPSVTGISDGSGCWIISRITSTDVKAYRNGGQVGSQSVTEATSMPSVEFYQFALNDNGTLNAPSTRAHALDFLSAGLSTLEAAYFTNNLSTFLQAAA